MSVLSGESIKKMLKAKQLGIEPFFEEGVQPASYDMRLGSKILVSPILKEKGKVIDLKEEKEKKYEIQPGQFVSVSTEEKISLPNNICGRFGLKSSFTRKGLILFGGAQVDPGWSGNLVFSLFNVGPEKIPIGYGVPIFTIEFHTLESPAIGYKGPYQGQSDFPDDDKKFIINAKTISLAEISQMRDDIHSLKNIVESFYKKTKEMPAVELIEWQNPFTLSLVEFNKLNFPDFKKLSIRAYKLLAGEIEKKFKENPNLRELALCDGKISFASDKEGGITYERVKGLKDELGKPCYIVTKPDIIEEVAWMRINDDDFYPTAQLSIGNELWSDNDVEQNGAKVIADFDTGNPGLTVFDEEISYNIIPRPDLGEFRLGSHLGRPYFYFIGNVKICIKDIRGNSRSSALSCRFVRDWNESPFVEVNLNREGFIGRHFLFLFNFKITLDPKSKISTIEYLG